MSRADHILVLIGLPGAGKTTVATHLVERLGAQHAPIGLYRDKHATAVEIADDLANAASARPTVFECSGASEDFEEILQQLAERRILSVVVNLDVTPATALRRLSSRVPHTIPKAGQDWSEHVEWVQTHLGLVPTDLDIDMEMSSPEKAAATIIDAWDTHRGSAIADASTHETITFSQLSRWQICGREYGYRHKSCLAPTATLPPIVNVGGAAHEALAWLFAPGTGERSLKGFLDIFESKIEADGRDFESLQVWGRQVLSDFYTRNYLTNETRTLAVESDVTLSVNPGVFSLVGRLDRLSLNLASELEVTEFKLRQTRRGSRPRVPALLQPAAYAAAVIDARRCRHAFARLHFLEQDRIERVLLSERGARNVRLALRRWVTSLRGRGLAAQPGHHCRHCGYRLICPFSAAPTSAQGKIGSAADRD